MNLPTIPLGARADGHAVGIGGAYNPRSRPAGRLDCGSPVDTARSYQRGEDGNIVD